MRERAQIAEILGVVQGKLDGLGRKVYAIVNYDDFSISPELLDDYAAMVRGLYERYYSGASRYATNGFLRIKLGQSLESRGVAPHIFESADEAAADWRHEAEIGAI